MEENKVIVFLPKDVAPNDKVNLMCIHHSQRTWKMKPSFWCLGKEGGVLVSVSLLYCITWRVAFKQCYSSPFCCPFTFNLETRTQQLCLSNCRFDKSEKDGRERYCQTASSPWAKKHMGVSVRVWQKLHGQRLLHHLLASSTSTSHLHIHLSKW